ncbi:MAG: type 1 glutamine amidotransferase [Rhodobacter sp.]|nr:type 1 glutamine amidotransferase [Rhodobacter sp.]
MTNTDESAFARRHPKDGEKFTRLIQEVRPDWTTEVHAVKDGVFPESLEGIDGAMITGSPASAQSNDPWVLALLQVIRDAVAVGLPLFGACFGHQAIARALGGKVGFNDGPFVLGIVEVEAVGRAPWMGAAPDRFRLAAAHGEQVTAMPAGAVLNSAGPGCPIGGFHIGDRVFTTEYHPEMTHDFISALIDILAGKMDADVIEPARASLDQPADRAVFAEWIARFFEVRR